MRIVAQPAVFRHKC